MPKKVIIIGGGMSGLIAGCYLRMNGYETRIFEMHSVPGGLCTSWNKNGYTIDGCLHWLVGSAPSDNFHELWNELIDLRQLTFVDHEVHQCIEDSMGKTIRVFTDVDKLESELLEKAPEDEKLTREMCRLVRKLSKMNMPNQKAAETMNLPDKLRFFVQMAPYLGIFGKYLRMSASGYAARFRNPLMKKLIEYLFLPEMSVLFLFFTMAWMNKRSAGYPLGGSLAFARLFEKRYLGLGGEIHYSSRVRRILYKAVNKSNSASGIELENGEVHSADIVISAADGHSTIWELLDGKFTDPEVESVYRDFSPFPSYLQVSIGIKGKAGFPEHSMLLPLDPRLNLDPETSFDYLQLVSYHFDPNLAPEGSSLLISVIPTYNHEYWINLKKNDPVAYKSEKQRVADSVIRLLEKRFGINPGQIEMVDVSTPSTVIRYTGNWKGSFEGWLLTPKTGLRQIRKTLPGLQNFYMIGQWVEPGGGIPSCMISGRNVTQIICKKDGQKFISGVQKGK